jgi:hypothetical protein
MESIASIEHPYILVHIKKQTLKMFLHKFDKQVNSI